MSNNETQAATPGARRPSLIPVRRRQPVDPAELEKFAAGAGHPVAVLSTDAEMLAEAQPGTASVKPDTAPDAVSLTSPTRVSAKTSIEEAVKALESEGQVLYNQKQTTMFRMTPAQSDLLEAVYSQSRFKSKQDLMEYLLIPGLVNYAKQNNLK